MEIWKSDPAPNEGVCLLIARRSRAAQAGEPESLNYPARFSAAKRRAINPAENTRY